MAIISPATLSQKSETVAENGETTATVSLFCDSVDRLLVLMFEAWALLCGAINPSYEIFIEVCSHRNWGPAPPKLPPLKSKEHFTAFHFNSRHLRICIQTYATVTKFFLCCPQQIFWPPPQIRLLHSMIGYFGSILSSICQSDCL